MRADNLDMLTMLDEAKKELGVQFLVLRIEATDASARQWRFFLADPGSPAGQQVFSVTVHCPPRARFETIKAILKQRLLAHHVTSVAC